MSAKDDILAALRAARGAHEEVPTLPPVFEGGIRYPDPVAQFSEALSSVGGHAVVLAATAQLPAALAELPVVREARRLVCAGRLPIAISELALSGTLVDLSTVTDPRSLADIDVAIATGRLAVAENGAVWVSGDDISQPAALFLCQHLVLVVPAAAVVHNLHEAYARIDAREAGYGLFISGPSKTADIEQSLVIGAHGPRSATVFLT